MIAITALAFSQARDSADVPRITETPESRQAGSSLARSPTSSPISLPLPSLGQTQALWLEGGDPLLLHAAWLCSHTVTRGSPLGLLLWTL